MLSDERAAKRRRVPWVEIALFAVGITAGAGVWLYAHRDEPKIDESKRIGQAVVEAIERYREERGHPPASLEELVPRYIERIEPPTWGLRRWHYRRFDQPAGQPASPSAATYVLSAPANERNYPVLYYDIVERRWILNN